MPRIKLSFILSLILSLTIGCATTQIKEVHHNQLLDNSKLLVKFVAQAKILIPESDVDNMDQIMYAEREADDLLQHLLHPQLPNTYDDETEHLLEHAEDVLHYLREITLKSEDLNKIIAQTEVSVNQIRLVLKK